MQIIKIIDQLFPYLADELHCSDLDCPLDLIDFISRVLVPEAARCRREILRIRKLMKLRIFDIEANRNQ